VSFEDELDGDDEEPGFAGGPAPVAADVVAGGGVEEGVSAGGVDADGGWDATGFDGDEEFDSTFEAG
jgi:hypothetical protein